MCRIISAIITKKDVIAYANCHSHTDIRQAAGISEAEDAVTIPSVAVELLPPTPFTMELDKWKFGVDQDLTPAWFDKEDARLRLLEFLERVPRIAKGETRDVVVDNVWFCEGVINRLYGYVLFLTGTVNEVRGNGTVNKVWDDGTVNVVRDNGTVNEVWGNGKIVNDYRTNNPNAGERSNDD